MPTYSRRQFLESLRGPVKTGEADNRIDVNFHKYSNKTLPAQRKTMSLSLEEYGGEWGPKQIKHLLGRTMFGVRQQDVDILSLLTMQASVDLLLTADVEPLVPPVNHFTPEGEIDKTGILSGATWITAPYGSPGLNFARCDSLKAWWLMRQVNQNLSITEKMVLFWHNHFATQTLVVEDARCSYYHYEKLYKNVLGNFKQLANIITKDPAMLLYLNGYVNTKYHPDENYGRELQELFTVGKDNSINYTEDDVKSAARVLTGWTTNSSIFESYFLPQLHDNGDKQFSAFYNNKVILGRDGAEGAAETDELLDMIFSKTEAATYLCTKLYRFFVYYNITEEVKAEIIAPLATLLVANNFEMKPVMEKLLKSQHFYDVNNMGCYIKNPLDHFVGILRTFGVQSWTQMPYTNAYKVATDVHTYGTLCGMHLGDPPNVAGWPAYYQAPAYYQTWINSSTFPKRTEFTDMLLAGKLGENVEIGVDVIEFAKLCNNAADPELLSEWLTQLLLGVPLDAAGKKSMMDILLSGQENRAYWTEAWILHVQDPNEENKNSIETRLRTLLGFLLRLPECQLC